MTISSLFQDQLGCFDDLLGVGGEWKRSKKEKRDWMWGNWLSMKRVNRAGTCSALLHQTCQAAGAFLRRRKDRHGIRQVGLEPIRSSITILLDGSPCCPGKIQMVSSRPCYRKLGRFPLPFRCAIFRNIGGRKRRLISL